MRADDPTLAELQRRFFALVTAPESVARTLAARPADDVTTFVTGDARATAVERLDVYANMYFFRILDVLRSDYPKLLAVLGDDAFHDLATDYLAAHPSQHPSLRFVGASLPTFLAGHAHVERRPWLETLAALEWARVDVFDRADVAPLAREALAAVAPGSFASISLRAVPAFALVPAPWDVAPLWRALEEDPTLTPADSPARTDGTPALLVWRRGVAVHHRAVDGTERRALALLPGGTTFGALCAALADQLGSDEAAAARAVALLGGWLADELLAA